jgi:hypothetical protein
LFHTLNFYRRHNPTPFYRCHNPTQTPCCFVNRRCNKQRAQQFPDNASGEGGEGKPFRCANFEIVELVSLSEQA